MINVEFRTADYGSIMVHDVQPGETLNLPLGAVSVTLHLGTDPAPVIPLKRP